MAEGDRFHSDIAEGGGLANGHGLNTQTDFANEICQGVRPARVADNYLMTSFSKQLSQCCADVPGANNADFHSFLPIK
jgi:hypothetical protein